MHYYCQLQTYHIQCRTFNCRQPFFLILDIKQYIGVPSIDACYNMLRGSILELKNKGVIACNETIHPIATVKFECSNISNSKKINQLSMNGHVGSIDTQNDINMELPKERSTSVTQFTLKLYEEAQRCQSFSGRTLRKLPFLALTEFDHGGHVISAQQFLTALHNCITTVQNDLKKV